MATLTRRIAAPIGFNTGVRVYKHHGFGFNSYHPMRTYLRAVNFRRLAAIDIALLGYKFVLTEYASGVVLSAALAIFVLFRGHSFWQTLLGVYLICLGINYVPMLVYTLAIASRQNAQAQMADELAEKRRALSKYRRQSLLLLVPLLVVILAVAQE
jgi:hypothetical protein